MGDLLKHITEKLLNGEFTPNYEERRRPYPNPGNWFDCLDGCGTAAEDTKSGGIPTPTVKGKQTKDRGNPLRRGDNSTII